MNLGGVGEWIAWAGVVLPLCAFAWSAVFYTLTRRRESAHAEYRRVFEITNQLGHSGGSIASKMAADYELRKYPQYKDVIISLCEKTEVIGSSAQMLKDEMMARARFLRSL